MSRSVVSATRVAHPPTTPTRTRASIEGRPQGVTPNKPLQGRTSYARLACGTSPKREARRCESVAAFPGHYAIACAAAQNRGRTRARPRRLGRSFWPDGCIRPAACRFGRIESGWWSVTPRFRQTFGRRLSRRRRTRRTWREPRPVSSARTNVAHPEREICADDLSLLRRRLRHDRPHDQQRDRQHRR